MVRVDEMSKRKAQIPSGMTSQRQRAAKALSPGDFHSLRSAMLASAVPSFVVRPSSEKL